MEKQRKYFSRNETENGEPKNGWKGRAIITLKARLEGVT